MKIIFEDIRSIGFDIDYFGKNSVVINGTPAGINDVNEKDLIEGFIEEVKNNNTDIEKREEYQFLNFSQKSKNYN